MQEMRELSVAVVCMATYRSKNKSAEQSDAKGSD